MAGESIEQSLREGNLEETLTQLQAQVRVKADDPKLRVFLFQLLCVLGQWDRALTQLDVLSGLDAESALLAQIFEPVVRCERLRADVFAGKRTPLIFGEPEEWLGLLVHANNLAAEGKFAEAIEVQGRALDAAPATPGSVDGKPFQWIADADSRLGPVIEAFIDGKYYWVPFTRVTHVQIERPVDLRDLVWIAATLTLANGGATGALIPVRYPGSESAADGAIRMSRKTEWVQHGENFFFGLGQRSFATDDGDYALLEVQKITLDSAPAPADLDSDSAPAAEVT